MEVAVLTARLEAITTQFTANMRVAQGQADQMQNKLRDLEKESFAARKALKDITMDASQTEATKRRASEMQNSVDNVYRAALRADDAIEEIGFQPGQVAKFIAETKMMERELNALERDLKEAKRAANDINAGATSRAAADNATLRNATELTRMRTGAIREQFIETERLTRAQTESSVASNRSAQANEKAMTRLRSMVIQQRFNERVHGMIPTQDMRGLLIPTRDLRQIENQVDRDAISAGGMFGGRGNRRPNDQSTLERFVRGILPGGRRAGAAATTTAIGLLGALGPGALPGLAGGAIAGADVLTGLVGALGTTALALHGLTAESFKTQAAFDKLTPAQQKFVQTLRSLDAGLLKGLEATAQRTLLPGLTAGARKMFTPALTGALNTSVGAFGTGISSGVQNAASIFGSANFAKSFQSVMVANAKYTEQFITALGHLTSAFFHLIDAAKPLTDWLSAGVLRLSIWADKATQAAQANGTLAKFFDRAKISLQAMAGFLESVLGLLRSFGEMIGFKNSIELWRTLSNIVRFVTKTLDANKMLMRDFFAGALAAINDVLAVLEPILTALSQILRILNKLVGGTNAWRYALDALFAVLSLKALQSILLKLGAIGVAEATLASGARKAAVEVGGLRGALLSLGSASVLGRIATTALKIGGIYLAVQQGVKLITGQSNMGLDFSNSVSAENFGAVGAVPNTPGSGYPRGTDQHEAFWAGLQNKPLSKNLAGAQKNVDAYYQGLAAGHHMNTLKGIGGVASIAQGLTAGPFKNPKDFGQALNPFGVPDPLVVGTGTGRGTALPIKMQIAFQNAVNSGNQQAIISTARQQVAWLQAHKGKMTPTEQLAASQEIGYLNSQIQQSTAAISTAKKASAQAFQDATRAPFDRYEVWKATGHHLGVTRGDMSRINHAQAAAERTAAKTAATRQQRVWERMLGIGPGVTPSAQSVQKSERDMLLRIVKSISKPLHHRGVAGDPFAAIPDATHMSVPNLIKSLQAHGAHFSKRALADFALIRKILDQSIKSGVKLTPESTDQIRALLKQIEQNTRGAHAAMKMYHLPSIKTIMQGLHDIKNPIKRRKIADSILGIYGGMVPSYAAVAGTPVLRSGANVPIHGGVHITIQGYEKDPKVLAAMIRNELLKHGRRNPTQTRGPNAGRNLGLT